MLATVILVVATIAIVGSALVVLLIRMANS